MSDGPRALGRDDIPALIALARAALPDTMASRLGPRFAARYFRALLGAHEVQVEGYFRDGALVGFIIYTADVREALRLVFRRHAPAFTLALLPALLSPRRLAYVVRIALTVLAGRREAGDDVAAELLSIGLLPEARGPGVAGRQGVAGALLDRACQHLAARGVGEVKVFCKPEEMEPVANRFVRREGFERRGRVVRFGIPSTLYVKALGSGQPSGRATAAGPQASGASTGMRSS